MYIHKSFGVYTAKATPGWHRVLSLYSLIYFNPLTYLAKNSFSISKLLDTVNVGFAFAFNLIHKNIRSITDAIAIFSFILFFIFSVDHQGRTYLFSRQIKINRRKWHPSVPFGNETIEMSPSYFCCTLCCVNVRLNVGVRQTNHCECVCVRMCLPKQDNKPRK